MLLLRLYAGVYRWYPIIRKWAGISLRVDDRLGTALRNIGQSNGTGDVGQWRQLIDLLAQNPVGQDPQLVAAGLVRARELASKLTVEERIAGVSALAGRIKSAPLVQLLSGDIPAVAAIAIAGADLDDGQWAELVPELPVRARGFLRNRKDIGPSTRLALSNWAGADFRIAGEVEAVAEANEALAPEKPVSQIGAIVERIEQWRRNRDSSEAPRLPFVDDEVEIALEPSVEIRFETDDNGTIVWVEGAPRGAIVGVDIAQPAYDDGPGPDAYAAAAFRQRMPMENARMTMRGSPMIDGDWRISASPFFDALTGRFRGFRGIMRRPNLTEKAEFSVDFQAERKRQGETMQQVVHELRTPLGAIAGFAEIIEQQLFGPVSGDYRSMASAILVDAQRLLAGFDDLSTAARLDSGNLELDDGITECSWLVRKLADRLATISDQMDVDINLIVADPARPFAVDRDLAERIFSRLVSAIIIGCTPGERLHGRIKTEVGRSVVNSFKLDLPLKLRGLSDAELFGSSAIDPENSDVELASPLLGLGFSLRLVRNLARKVGGDLRFQKESLLLTLPTVQNGDLDIRDIGGD